MLSHVGRRVVGISVQQTESSKGFYNWIVFPEIDFGSETGELWISGRFMDGSFHGRNSNPLV